MTGGQESPPSGRLLRCTGCYVIYDERQLVGEAHPLDHKLVAPCTRVGGACRGAHVDAFVNEASLDRLHEQARRGGLIQKWAESKGISVPDVMQVFLREKP